MMKIVHEKNTKDLMKLLVFVSVSYSMIVSTLNENDELKKVKI